MKIQRLLLKLLSMLIWNLESWFLNGLFIREKNKQGGRWACTSETPGIFRFVILPLEILEKTSFHSWEFCKFVCVTLVTRYPWKNSKVKTKTHGSSTWFFLTPLEIPLLFYLTPGISTCSFVSAPGNYMSSTPPPSLDFFWNSLILNPKSRAK